MAAGVSAVVLGVGGGGGVRCCGRARSGAVDDTVCGLVKVRRKIAIA